MDESIYIFEHFSPADQTLYIPIFQKLTEDKFRILRNHYALINPYTEYEDIPWMTTIVRIKVSETFLIDYYDRWKATGQIVERAGSDDSLNHFILLLLHDFWKNDMHTDIFEEVLV